MPNFDTVLLNKQNWCKSKDDIWVLHHKFHRARWKQKQSFTFWNCVDNCYLWKDIVRKKVSKLRSIAELRAFYGTFLLFWSACKRTLFIYRVGSRNLRNWTKSIHINKCCQTRSGKCWGVHICRGDPIHSTMDKLYSTFTINRRDHISPLLPPFHME
jgi:hypothetical protein